MPYYKHTVMCLPKYPLPGLVKSFRKVAETVFAHGKNHTAVALFNNNYEPILHRRRPSIN